MVQCAGVHVQPHMTTLWRFMAAALLWPSALPSLLLHGALAGAAHEMYALKRPCGRAYARDTGLAAAPAGCRVEQR